MPTFASPTQRQRAEQLLQPTLIRVIDNLRKLSEETNRNGTYEERQVWPAGTTESEKEQVQQLLKQLQGAEDEAVPALEQQLQRLPQPFPTYELHLPQEADRPPLVIDIWELCYRVCFTNYHPEVPVKVDANLLEADGDIDWIALDEKAKGLISVIFKSPDVSS